MVQLITSTCIFPFPSPTLFFPYHFPLTTQQPHSQHSLFSHPPDISCPLSSTSPSSTYSPITPNPQPPSHLHDVGSRQEASTIYRWFLTCWVPSAVCNLVQTPNISNLPRQSLKYAIISVSPSKFNLSLYTDRWHLGLGLFFRLLWHSQCSQRLFGTFSLQQQLKVPKAVLPKYMCGRFVATMFRNATRDENKCGPQMSTPCK